MKGRKPKPLEQRRREGNPGKRPLPAPLRLPDTGQLVRPDDLPPEALSLWDQIVPALHHVGVLHQVDGAALRALCVLWARAERARMVISEEGFFATGSMGQLVEHPALDIERKSLALFLRFAEQYGITAAARARIARDMTTRPPVDDSDQFDAIEEQAR